MSLSRRNRRLGLYAYSSSTVEGVATDVWTLAGTWWGRVDAASGQLRMRAGMLEPTIDAIAQLSDEVTVPANAVLVDGTSYDAAAAYHVRAVRIRRDQRVQYVGVEQLGRDKVDAPRLLLDGSFILDGSQILNGVQS